MKYLTAAIFSALLLYAVGAGAQAPNATACNGLDDDGDGLIDEDYACACNDFGSMIGYETQGPNTLDALVWDGSWLRLAYSTPSEQSSGGSHVQVAVDLFGRTTQAPDCYADLLSESEQVNWATGDGGRLLVSWIDRPADPTASTQLYVRDVAQSCNEVEPAIGGIVVDQPSMFRTVVRPGGGAIALVDEQAGQETLSWRLFDRDHVLRGGGSTGISLGTWTGLSAIAIDNRLWAAFTDQDGALWLAKFGIDGSFQASDRVQLRPMGAAEPELIALAGSVYVVWKQTAVGGQAELRGLLVDYGLNFGAERLLSRADEHVRMGSALAPGAGAGAALAYVFAADDQPGTAVRLVFRQINSSGALTPGVNEVPLASPAASPRLVWFGRGWFLAWTNRVGGNVRMTGFGCNCVDNDADGVTPCDGDCDDAQALVRPGLDTRCSLDANAACDIYLDSDCDGRPDRCEMDLDGDGATPCGPSLHLNSRGSDCNDANPLQRPGRGELCGNSVDDDCDGVFDEAGTDADVDGIAIWGQDRRCNTNDDDCDDGDPMVGPGLLELCDGKDNDCDGTVDEGFAADVDGDGALDQACGGEDCNDRDETLGPHAPEICDQLDNDCDGNSDNLDQDGDGANHWQCGGTTDPDCDDDDASIGPGMTELCDLIDNNCDGVIDERFNVDGDVAVRSCTDDDGVRIRLLPLVDDTILVCQLFQLVSGCEDFLDCDDSNAAVGGFLSGELCDGLDNDCDNEVDELFPEADQDGDGENSTFCGGTDCDDNNPAVGPDFAEVCDAVDNDCRGEVDEGYDTDGDGFSVCSRDCDDNNREVGPNMVESWDVQASLCSNDLDDDCDGLSDSADPDCPAAEPVLPFGFLGCSQAGAVPFLRVFAWLLVPILILRSRVFPSLTYQ